MSVAPGYSYRFAKPAQWDLCLFQRADRATRAGSGLSLAARFGQTPSRINSPNAFAPAICPDGDLMWLTKDGFIHRQRTDGGDSDVESIPAPSLREATRILVTREALWVRSADNTLACFDPDSMTPLHRSVLSGESVVDIAEAGVGGSVFAFVRGNNQRWQARRVDCSGAAYESVTFDPRARCIAAVKGFAFLRSSQRFVFLGDDYLHWFSSSGAVLLSLSIASFHTCLKACELGSDATNRIVIAGRSPEDGKRFIVIDAEGSPLDDLGVASADSTVSGVAFGKSNLIATGPRGVMRFSASDATPTTGGDLSCIAVTPMLESSPKDNSAPWHRVEVHATLPDACSLQITTLATDDIEVRDRVKQFITDTTVVAGARIAAFLNDSDLHPSSLLFQGSGPGDKEILAAAPLRAVRARYLWVCLELFAGPGATARPAVSEMNVLYQSDSLINHLPSIYRRDAESSTDSFIGNLIGVLETTTQDLDSRIASLGSLTNPASARGPWLDVTARWLGLPWDEELSDDQKRCLLRNAEALARQRGTRAGLELLLKCITASTAKATAFRIIDSTADYGFAVLGGCSCPGARLPAMIAGLERPKAELDTQAIVGLTRLPSTGDIDEPAARLVGQIRVEVAATATERRKSEPWLLALIQAMAPVTTRVSVHWVSAAAMRSDRLGDSVCLEAEPAPPNLGEGAIVGSARLPETTASLFDSGLPIGVRLR